MPKHQSAEIPTKRAALKPEQPSRRFTSRGPRNRNEIAACVEYFRYSPLWTPTSLSEEEIVDCWVKLLESGLGVIDIYENKYLAQDLINPDKAKNDPHFKHGFVHVVFACYISFDVAKDILTNQDDKTEPTLRLLELYHAHCTNPSEPNPLHPVDAKGKFAEVGFCMLVSSIFHSDIATHLSIRTFKYWQLKTQFADRVLASLRRAYIGMKHDLIIHSAAGQFLNDSYCDMGFRIVRENPNNKLGSLVANKYIYAMSKGPVVWEKLNLLHLIEHLPPGRMKNVYEFMFMPEPLGPVRPIARLSRRHQVTCSLLLLNFSHDHIAQFLFRRAYKKASREIQLLNEKQAVAPLGESDRLKMKNAEEALTRLRKRVHNLQYTAITKLYLKGLLELPFASEQLVSSILADAVVAQEVRQFSVRVFPWPADLDTRSM